MRTLALAAVLLVPSMVYACLHPGGSTQTTSVSQEGQQALIVHHDGVEDLILKVEYAGLAGAASLAWVVPVPAAPSEYGTTDAGLFEDLDNWVRLRWVERRRTRRRGGVDGPRSSSSSLVLLEAAQVGPFAIQPIQGRGPGAGVALNEWMTGNGFQAIPDTTLAYYLERNWTFLAIKVTPGGADTMAERAGLPPLRITFPSDRAVFPLKLSTHMGEFPVRAYLVTATPLVEEDFGGARARGFEVLSGGWYHRAHGSRRRGRLESRVAGGRFTRDRAPETLQPLLRRMGDAPLHLSILLSERFNRTSRSESVQLRAIDWTEDLSVPGLAEGQRLMGVADESDESDNADNSESVDSDSELESSADSESESQPVESASEDESDSTSASESESSGCSVQGGASLAWAWLALLWRRRI